MMIKVFTTDKNGKIVLSGKELKELLDEAYWEGFRTNSRNTWTYTTPSWSPFYYTTSTSGSATISLSNEAKTASNAYTTTNTTTGQGNNNITAAL